MDAPAKAEDRRKPEIILIAAMAANRVIGKGNAIPWHIPEELQRFKRITMGHTLIMGRKTHESIGRVLPGRRTIVISRQRDFEAAGCTVVQGLEKALDLCQKDEKVFIAGGAEIFRLALPYADAIYLSVLHREVEGDILFPEFSEAEFPLASSETVSGPDPYTFAVYRRRSV
ncbi:MAG: dihydrofolate reductase [Thermodesulfobacteriota bacterium]